MANSKRGVCNSQAFDMDAWADREALTEMSSPDLGEEDAELNSGHVDNLGINKQ